MFLGLEKIIQNNLGRSLYVAGSLFGASLLGCSKDSSSPTQPKINKPPKIEISNPQVSYYIPDMGPAKGDTVVILELAYRAWDDDGHVKLLLMNKDDGGWFNFIDNTGKKNPFVLDGMGHYFYDKRDHTILCKAVDNDGVESLPAKYDFIYRAPSPSDFPTPVDTVIPPPPDPEPVDTVIIGDPNQVIITSSIGEVIINSSMGESRRGV